MASLRNTPKAAAEAHHGDEPGAPLLGTPDRVADHLNNRIFFRLFQVANTLQKQAVKELGVTTVQWAVLGALSDPRPTYGVSVGTLADFLVVSRQNLDGVLKRLERDGLVEKVTVETDKRARLVKLTPEGFAFWKELRERIFQFYDQAVSSFKFDNRVALAHYLNELQNSLTEVSLEQPRKERKKGKKRS
ncbi:MarR family transcriptional regulator [Tardiphaga sp. OK245]|uniref:MarR family winged helix-turn-helix transcriptional regulator n=1 Tax=Tardiphaga sp. OK245 TaxID=1855306 RepID=UPI0008A7CA85|nr:MarR family transcriptional regulator [Tardiphaga sp. OK245]SEH88082.1 transcriptional regulator, MarR family [Tardiphaga sp. OK245]